MGSRVLKAAFALAAITLTSGSLYLSHIGTAAAQSSTFAANAYQSRLNRVDGRLKNIESQYYALNERRSSSLNASPPPNMNLDKDLYQYVVELNQAFKQAVADAQAAKRGTGGSVENFVKFEETAQDHWRRFSRWGFWRSRRRDERI